MSRLPYLPRLQPVSVRSIRLTTGLVLFTYVGTHLLNHALGNVSLAWLERDLLVQKFIWQGWPGTVVLYTSLVTHFCLGLWALYERRALHWTAGEVAQLVLGLCIPPLLANHLTATRIAFAEFGLNKGYAQELYSFWIDSPFFGGVQLILLVVAWLHGCYGIWFWLRLKPWFDAWRSVLLSAAVLIPVLALLGFLQGGREVLALARDPVWRAATTPPRIVGTAPEKRWLVELRNDFLIFDGGALLLVLVARLVRTVRERRAGRLCVLYPDGRKIFAPRGFSVLERLGADADTVRLACQLRPAHDLSVWPLVPPAASAAFLHRRQRDVIAQERFAAFMFVDMRDSTRLAAAQLPFDTIFLASRFLSAVSLAIVEAGGSPNQFLGDSVLAIFGLSCEASTACRQALRAVPLVAANIDALSTALEPQLQTRIRFGIGLHCGRAVMGEIGFREHVTFTAIGDPLNVASRLEQLTKEIGCEAIVSDEVFRRAGVPAGSLPNIDARLRGIDAVVPVRVLAKAVAMPR